LPINHSAVLRFKTDVISKMIGIPFKKVRVQKGIWFEDANHQPTPMLTNLYSFKVLGSIQPRSIMSVDSVDRFIPPDNFQKQLAARCDIVYDSKIEHIAEGLMNTRYSALIYSEVISTIPLPVMLKLCGLEAHDVELDYELIPIHTMTITIKDCCSYSTIYYPALDMGIYRASINGNKLIIESTGPIEINSRELKEVFESFGIHRSLITDVYSTAMQINGKLSDVPDRIRKDIIFQLTNLHRIYSVGRFATWRPKLMLDDIVEDVFVVRRLMSQGNYEAMYQIQKEEI